MRGLILPVLLACGLVAGCASSGTSIQGFNDAAGATYLAIGSASDLLYSLCRNEAPGADCAPGAAIGTEDAQRAAGVLRDAVATVSGARALYVDEGDYQGAMARLQEARRLVAITEAILREAEQ